MNAITLSLSLPLLAGAIAAQQPQAASLLDAPVVVADSYSRIDQIVDLDLDGDLDGVGIWFNETQNSSQPIYLEVSMHANDGAGRLQKSVLHRRQTTSGSQPTDYNSVVGDFDGDGHDDFFTTLDHTYCRSRAGGPLVSTLFRVNPLPHDAALHAADIDGDGADELIVGTSGFGPGIYVFRLTATVLSFAGRTQGNVYASGMVVGDATGDGIPEGIVYEGASLGIGVYDLASPSIARLGAIPVPASANLLGASALTAGDLERDGDTDYVLFGPLYHMVVECVGPSQFVAQEAAIGGPATHLFDFDGDGDLDGCCCGGGTGISLPNPNRVLGQFEYAENLGNGQFARAWRMPSVGPFHLAGCADMNGDGHNDLVGGRCIYFGPGTRDPLGGSPNPTRATVADIDGDGDPDVVDPNGAWRNMGDGSFAAGPWDLPALAAGQSWSTPRAGDFDGDGDIDLLAHRVGDPASAMHLLRNAGGGHFGDTGPVTAPGMRLEATLPLRVFDYDGDGNNDLIETRTADTRIWVRDAAGQYAPTATWPMRRVIGEGDFDGDGLIDLLAAVDVTSSAPLSWDIAVLHNAGNGTFVPGPSLTVWSAREMAIIDYDGDNDLDLISWTYNGTTSLVVLTNDGSNGFAVGPTLLDGVSVDEYEGQFRIVDLDQDGLWDIVAGPSRYPDVLRADDIGVWVVRQFAPMQFEASLYLAGYGDLVDVDGDGDLDVVGKHLVTNTTFQGPSAGHRLQYGAATSGSSTAAPTLGITGPFRVGATVHVRLRGGVGGGFAVIKAGFQSANRPVPAFPALTYHIDQNFDLATVLLAGTPDAPGEGAADVALTLPAFMRGLPFYIQAFVLEPNAPPITVTQTGGVAVLVGG